jgi:RNA polymerase sigma-70 factor (ECF subfamily)
VQQIFLKVLTEVPKYKVEYFKSWLYMVAKNQCLMKLRGRGTKEMKELSEHIVAEEDANKDVLSENELTYHFLEEALNEISEEQRVCVTLFYLQKASYTQISERTGYSLLQVKSYIQNGKRNLKLLLQKKLKANKAK